MVVTDFMFQFFIYLTFIVHCVILFIILMTYLFIALLGVSYHEKRRIETGIELVTDDEHYYIQ
jgi:hypothetical protein